VNQPSPREHFIRFHDVTALYISNIAFMHPEGGFRQQFSGDGEPSELLQIAQADRLRALGIDPSGEGSL
jgi:hypothetical protein